MSRAGIEGPVVRWRRGLLLFFGIAALAVIMLFGLRKNPRSDHVHGPNAKEADVTGLATRETSADKDAATAADDPSIPAPEVEKSPSAEPARRRESSQLRTIIVIGKDDERVTDATVYFVAETKIDANSPEASEPLTLLQSLALASKLTGSDGIVGLEDARVDLIIVRKPGFASEYRWLEDDKSSGASIRIEMKRTIGIHGLVIDGVTRVPIAGARIVAIPRYRAEANKEENRGILDRVLLGQSTLSDGSGHFMLDEARDEKHTFRCSAAGYPPALVDNALPTKEDIIVRLEGECDVMGRVIDEEGKPVANAMVDCSPKGQFPTPISDSSRTDAEGHFLLHHLPTGLVVFRTIAEGFAREKTPCTLVGHQDPPLEIVLAKEAEFSGMVVDHLGKPIPGAYVSVCDRTQATTPSYMETEDDGTWYQKWIKAGNRLEILVRKEGYFEVVLHNLTAPRNDLIVTLLKPGTAYGVVIDDKDRPVSDFSIRGLWGPANVAEELDERQAEEWKQRSSADGRFEIDLWPGPNDMWFRAPGFMETRLSGVDIRPVERTGPLQIKLLRGASISGRVVDAAHAPVGGARVSLMERMRSGEAVRELPNGGSACGSDGSFAIDGLPPTGSFDLLVSASGFGPLVLTEQRTGDFPRDLVLLDPGSIEGRVILPWRSLETVAIVRARPLGTALIEETRPDPYGHFRIDELGAGPHLVELIDEWTHSELGSTDSVAAVVDVAPGAVSSIDLRGGTGCLIEGTVAGESFGKPRTNLRIELRCREGDATRAARTTSPDDTGLYYISAVQPGHYVVRLESTCEGLALGLSKKIEVDAGQTHAQVDFDVSSDAFRGRVSAGQAGVADASVALVDRDSGAAGACTLTDPDGRYCIARGADGAYLVWVNAPGRAEEYSQVVTWPLEAGTTSLEHRLAPESRILVNIVDDQGAAVSRAAVTTEVDDRPRVLPTLTQLSDETGRVAFNGLRAGTTRVSARCDGHEPASTSAMTIATGETRTLRLALVRHGSLIVSVVDEHRKLRAGVPVQISRAGASNLDRHSLESDSSGRASFSDLAPGVWLVEAAGSSPDRIEVFPGSTSELLVTLGAT